MGMLSILALIPIVGAIVLSLLPANPKLARQVGLGFAGVTFLVSVAVFARFSPNTFHFQFEEKHSWIPSLGIGLHFGVDGISIWLLLLTTFLSLISIAYAQYVNDRTKAFLAMILLLEAAMLGSFVSLDLIAFFTFFEATLIPMWLLINNWGGEKRTAAANKFLIYTFAGSMFMLLGMVVMAAQMRQVSGVMSFDIVDIQNQVARGGFWVSGMRLETLVFWAFVVAFLVKSPSFPFHTWIADTYAEAPIVGPILSSAMVKLGSFGLLRFVLPLFPDVIQAQAPLLMGLAVVSILYGAVVAAVQNDMRRMLAYSSVSHMGFVLLGIFSLSYSGVLGGTYQQVNHGIVTSALFLLVGFLFVRTGETRFSAFGGLKAQMPVFAALFLVAMLAGVGLPGTNGFVGEFLALLGSFESGFAAKFGLSIGFTAAAAGGVVLSAAYLLYLYQQVFYGPVANAANRRLKDLKNWEAGTVGVLVVVILWGGLCPSTFTRPMEASAQAARLMAIGPVGARPIWQEQSLEVDIAPEDPTRGSLVRATRNADDTLQSVSFVAPGQLHFKRAAEPNAEETGDVVR